MFVLFSLLVVIGRLYDAIATYFYTPDLTNETNILVKLFGAGWISFAIVQTVLVCIVIFLLYFYFFKFNPDLPDKRNLTIKQFASYLFFKNTDSFYKLFYEIPNSKKTLFAFVGYVVSMTLISISFIVGTSTVFLIVSESYKQFYKQGMSYFLYGLIVCIVIFFTVRFFKLEYKKYQSTSV